MKALSYTLALAAMLLNGASSTAQETLLKPPQVWADYDPNKGDFKQEIVKERVDYFSSTFKLLPGPSSDQSLRFFSV